MKLKKILFAFLLIFGISVIAAFYYNYEVINISNIESKENYEIVTFNPSLEMIKANVNVNNNKVAKSFSNMIEKNPNIGIENDFGFIFAYSYDFTSEDTVKVAFFAVNRVGVPLKNVDFNFSIIGNNLDIRDKKISLSENTIGVMPNNTATPVIVEDLHYTGDKETIIKDFQNAKYSVSNPTYQIVE